MKITLPEDIVRDMQQGHGGWVDDMRQALNELGTLLRFDDDGDAVVKFNNGKQFIYNPVVLEKVASAPVSAAKTTRSVTLRLGDLIRIEGDERRVKQLQEGHGGYNSEMKTCLGKVAYVRAITPNGCIRAKSGPRSWTWNQLCVKALSESELEALKAKNQADRTFLINDIVWIDSNLARVRRLQDGHGEWVDSMKESIGKYGYVKRVLDDGDLRVKVLGSTWTFNPDSVKKVVPARDSNSSLQRQPSQVDAGALLLRLLAALADDSSSTMSTLDAVKAGNVARLRQLKAENKLDVNEKHDGHALIEIACVLGQFQVVEWLIDEKCDIHVRDSDGDQAIHEAALYGHPNIVRYLIRKGADANSRNKRLMTPLHWAANKGSLMVVQVLVENGADVNAQDEQGDTALHDAINKDSPEIAKYLLQKNASLTLVNKRGFNPIQWMALKDRHQILQHTLDTREDAMEQINTPKEDGFTALHLAALNNNVQTMRTLCECEATQLNCASNSGQTPLHLATINRARDALEVLLETEGVDVNFADGDGDTPLHEAVRLFTLGQLSGFQEIIASAIGIATPDVTHPEEYAELAKLLVRHGANINAENNSQTTPVGLCLDSDMADALRMCADEYSKKIASMPPRQVSAEPSDPSKASNSFSRLASVPEASDNTSSNNYSTTYTEPGKNTETKRPPHGTSRKESDTEILRVQKELVEMRKRITCSICMDSPFQVVFQCGHGTCQECGARITECHICRTKIINRTVVHGLGFQ